MATNNATKRPRICGQSPSGNAVTSQQAWGAFCCLGFLVGGPLKLVLWSHL